MSLTKKDYELIAGVLKLADAECWTDHIELIAEEMADSLEQDNPKFDRNKFLTACGIVEKCYEEHASGKYAGATPPHYHD